MAMASLCSPRPAAPRDSAGQTASAGGIFDAIARDRDCGLRMVPQRVIHRPFLEQVRNHVVHACTSVSVWNWPFCKAVILQGLLEALKRSVLIEVNEGGNVRPDHAARLDDATLDATHVRASWTDAVVSGFRGVPRVSSPGCPKPAEFLNF